MSPILNPLNLFSRCFEPFESAAALVTTLVSALRNPGRHDALLFVNFFSTTLLFKWKYKYKYNNKYKYVSQFRATRCSALCQLFFGPPSSSSDNTSTNTNTCLHTGKLHATLFVNYFPFKWKYKYSSQIRTRSEPIVASF